MNPFIKNLKVRIQECGSKWAIALDGKPKDIKLQFNSFWNHGATNGELHWHTNERAIFHTDRKRFFNCLIKIIEYKLLDKQYPHSYFFEGEKGETKAAKVAPLLAQAEFDLIERVPWIVKYASVADTHEVGEIEACFHDGDNLTSRNARRKMLKERGAANVDGDFQIQSGGRW